MEGKHNKTTKKKRNGVKRILPASTVGKVFILLMAIVAVGLFVMLTVVKAFPSDVTIGIAASVILFLVLARLLFSSEKKVLLAIGSIVAVLYIFVYSMGVYYMTTTYAMFSKIGNSDRTATASDSAELTEEAFNVYITGIDQWASEKGYDLERSDVNMIVTVNPQTRRILLTSIPRDTYVELYHVPEMDKLTHTGVYGVDETINTVEKWLGIKLDYYVKLNFSAVRDIINAMGGIDVYSPVAFKTSLWGYEFQEGWNHLDGKEALFFARERKAFEGKDSLRVENQQRVMEAVLKKLMSSSTLLTKYGDIMDAASNNLETDMTTDEIQSLVRMQLEELGDWDIDMQKVEGAYDMDYVASLSHENTYSVYKAYPSSVEKVLDTIDSVMNPTEDEIKAAEENRKKQLAINFINKITQRENNEDDQ